MVGARESHSQTRALSRTAVVWSVLSDRLERLASGGTGGTGGGASSSGGGGASSPQYLDCVNAAGQDVKKLQQCADLIGK